MPAWAPSPSGTAPMNTPKPLRRRPSRRRRLRHPPVAPLPPKAIDALLPNPEKVAQVMGASQLAVFKSVDTVIDESPVIAQKNCVGAYAPAQASVYADTGYTAIRAQADPRTR